MSKYKIIFDLESTCCDKNTIPRHEMEIIEIGAVCLDENNIKIGSFQTFVRPIKHQILTEFCKELTGINQEDIDKETKFFSQAMSRFKDWIINVTNGEDYIIYSWGDYDKNQINKQYKLYGFIYPYLMTSVLSKHVNLKEVFAKHNNIKPMGVNSALKFKKLKFEGNLHRALDDANNISILYKTIAF